MEEQSRIGFEDERRQVLTLLLEQQEQTRAVKELLLRKVNTADGAERIIEEMDKKYTETEWYKQNGWMKQDGRFDLSKMAEFIQRSWERWTLWEEWKIASQSEEQQRADTHAQSGGDTLNPRMFVVSFPGAERGKVFHIIDVFMHLQIGLENGDIHVMNDNSTGQGEYRVDLRSDWVKLFSSLPQWQEVIKHLKSIENDKGERLYSDGKSGPEWFVDHWGLAAWNAANNSKSRGCGVIILKKWDKYTESKWCKLEFLFCKCLATKFPGSVFVELGWDAKFKNRVGYYMQGGEEFY